ncbi:hypothetical protein SAMN05443248_1945 [Bradyrhizobium erythrophlei]|uniref:Uncharacterized protein n=1 Tax=Bradyrhizobium erythrophlei TaxID=1437360 RepID=A0A1M5KS14_9BRAD|nr:hypothetical protein SAMN05443248_1945 [Bradyrhizobium erythrophlei]
MEFSRAPTVIGPTGRVNAQPDDRLREAIHSPQPSFRDGAPAPDLRCAIAHRGISRFRVRCFASPRNDSAGFLRRPFPREPSYSPTGNADSDTPSRSRRAFRASFARTFRPENRGRGECRAPDAPAASCALLVVSMHTSIHSEPSEITRHSRTQWFTAYTVLSPVIGFLATVVTRINPPT